MKNIRLGEVFQVSNERLGDYSEEPPVFAISKYDGVVLGSEYHERRVASEKLDTYKILQPEDWAYSTIHIDEGSIARNNHEFLGVVSPMYTILRWRGHDHDPRYFEHLLRSPEMLATYGDMAQGSIDRRRSLPWKRFSSISVSVPTINEQRRIVDLIGAVDEATEAAQNALQSLSNLLRIRRESAMQESPVARIAEDVFQITMGRQRSPQHASGENMIAYMRSANVLDGRLDMLDVKSMNFTPGEQEKYSLEVGDVLVTEGSASQDAVGAAALWSGELSGPVGFQNTLLRFRAKEGVTLGGFVFHWCRWAYESGAFREAANGTSILHIGSKRAEKMLVNMPDLRKQEAIVDELNTFESVIFRRREEVHSLRTLRAELLSALLSGAHRIPETYDELMGA